MTKFFELVNKIFHTIQSRFLFVFIILTLLPLILSFFFSVNVLKEIVELSQIRTLEKLVDTFKNNLVNFEKSQIIIQTIEADDDFKTKLFLNMKNQCYLKITYLTNENNLTAIALKNYTNNLQLYYAASNLYSDTFDFSILDKDYFKSLQYRNNNIFSVFSAPIYDKETKLKLANICLITQITNKIMDELITDSKAIAIICADNTRKIIAETNYNGKLSVSNKTDIFLMKFNEPFKVSNYIFLKKNLTDDLSLIVGIDNSDSNYIIWLTIRRFIIIGFILLLSSILLAVLTANKIIEPIKTLSYTLKENIKTTQLKEVSLQDNIKDEIYELTEVYNEMVKKLKTAQTQLINSSKLASIGQLSAGISHEINNPLVSILGYSQLLLEKIDKNDKHYKYLKTIEEDAKRCRTIITNLLSFARQNEPLLKKCDAIDIIKSTIALLEIDFRKNNIEIMFDNFAKNTNILADKNQLMQVFVNILINSVYSLQKSNKLQKIIKITVNNEIIESNELLKISIYDNGIGIADENLENIFNPFFTTKPPGEGTGLGLSISYSILQMHNATIKVNSKLNEFADFIILLNTV